MDEERKQDFVILRNRFLYKWAPVIGCVSYEGFSTNITSPVQFSEAFGNRDLTVSLCLWFNAHVGVGLYLFKQKYMEKADIQHRILYTVFGSVIFNFGSVLFWAMGKSIFPEQLRTIFGLLSGAGLIYVGKKYLEFVDSQV